MVNMAHGHHRHSRIGKLISARRRAAVDEDAGSDLLEDDPFQNSILPAVILPDENCDSKNSLCLEHAVNESDPLLEKRDETTSADPTLIETVLQIVDASSHTLFQSTATDFPMTISDSTGASYTLPGSDSLTTTASETASASVSIDLGLLTSPTPTPATQPTTSPLSETSFSSNSTISTQTSLTTTNSTTQLTSALRHTSATVINSPGWTSTPLLGPSSSTPSVTTTSASTSTSTSTQVHNYWSYSSSGSDSGYDPSSGSGSGSGSGSTSSSSYSTIPTSSTDYTTSSSGVYGGAESTGSATGTGSAPTTSETNASGDPTIDPETSKIVGGVVGSVAGLALILFLIFYYLRRRGFLMGKMGRPTMLGDAAAGAGAGAGSREVVERRESNDPLFTASYFAPAFMKKWRQSTATARSGSTIDSAPSERGFQKISGRKLPPVFTHGGDGYGGGLDGDSPTIPGFTPTSPATGPMGSPSYAPPPTSQYGGMPLDSKYTREVEEHTPPLRSNPVHLPISSSVNVATPITITPAHPVAQPQSAIPFAPRPDALGRSLHSFDGSRSSRFTEVIDP
ncbi:hypothetical protein N7517_002409 [Penicillium concentricum]|uniref:Uncharacterized protein n=1 Tax=Penicillium concentricum TaxID=293559 RepID=A0A9W9STQ1_9EURO|nr:uncharacterized protein N7517_002409 [Penicillium concentricum]KAJ5384498.1 hypothetical protein N7517_002409 [Penicillium concentricum]